MKKINLIIGLAAIFAFYSCQQNASSKVEKGNNQTTISTQSVQNAVMTFDKTVHDFGTIPEMGGNVQTTFKFTNTGGSPLLIVDARGSCGCTVPTYPKNIPIAPGESGEMVVSFDPSNKPNLQQKTVTISANTANGRETLRIKAMVTPDPVKQKQRDDQARARQNTQN
ncbi:MAG: hypothetical protein CMC57_06230 [Flavobacteriaceae bacterium]|nr:hypothetical protein [Flavobacteriaceae bacterium]|tara:strand:+ start:515 stop:1018 length:504 start_codon:yes stop_codon:yes gene_type:complete